MANKVHGNIEVQHAFELPASASVTRGALYGLDASGRLVPVDLADSDQDGKPVVMALQDVIGGAIDGEVRALCLVKGIMCLDAGVITNADAGKTVCVIDDAGTPGLSALITPNSRPVGMLLGVQDEIAVVTV